MHGGLPFLVKEGIVRVKREVSMQDLTTEEKGSTLAEGVWMKILRAAMELPGVKVNRAAFLARNLSPYVNDNLVAAAIERGPLAAGVEGRTLEVMAGAVIKNHRLAVSGISFTSALPPGPLQMVAVPMDMAQYFWHCVVVAQKLAYLHGWPELFDDPADLDEETLHVLTIFIGAMFGSKVAQEALSGMARAVSVEVVKRLPRKALTKYAWYALSRQVGKWMGVKVTKQGFARVVGRMIPIAGALFAGGITWMLFSRMARRLDAHLAEADTMRWGEPPEDSGSIRAEGADSSPQ